MTANRLRAHIATAAAIVALTALAGCSGTGSVNPAAAGAATKIYSVAERSAVPAVTGTLLAGGTYDIKQDAGHVVVLNFWGSWCPPCRIEAADLEHVYETYQARGVRFVGINIHDTHDAAVAYVNAHGVTYPNIEDPASRVALGFRAVPPADIPSTVVVDPQGRIAAIHLGPITQADMTAMLDKVMS